MPTRQHFEVWKSIADLAMGLMAVLALVLLLLLWQQSVKTERVEEDRERIRKEWQQLQQERSQFAIEIVRMLSTAHEIVESQNRAEQLVRTFFDESACPLQLTGDDKLVFREEPNAPDGTAADLYDSGDFQLNPQGQDAIRRCQRSFVQLASCLSPEARFLRRESAEVDGDEARPVCLLPTVASTPTGARESIESGLSFKQGIRQLRQGIEALVLEGNTDRQRYARKQIPPVGGIVGAVEKPDSFVKNAYLGSERARQALGHLLHVVREHDAGPNDALEVLMSRVRIESPSFGRYQVGPVAWRRTERGHEVGDAQVEQMNGEEMAAACHGTEEDGKCELARNLSLKLRWKKRALRRPFDEIRRRICSLLGSADGDLSALAKGLDTVKHDAVLLRSVEEALGPVDSATIDLVELRQRFACESSPRRK